MGAGQSAILPYAAAAIAIVGVAVGAVVLSPTPRTSEPALLTCPAEHAVALDAYVATLRAQSVTEVDDHKSRARRGSAADAAAVVGSMTPIRPMCIARYGATLASIGDTVALIGGEDDSSTDRATTRDVESWTGAQRLRFGRLAIPRRSPTATVLADGSVLVAGGYNDGQTALVRELELGSHAGPHGSVVWRVSGSLSTPRWGHTATLLADGAGVMIAGGGDNEPISNKVGSVELWRDGRVTVGAPLHTPRLSHTATLLADGRVLMVGGVGHGGEVLSSVEIYDPATRTVRAAAPLHTPRRDHTATLLADGRVLVIGGQSGSYEVTFASAEIFDPRTGAWTPAGSLAFARAFHTAVRLRDGRVLVAGGMVWVCSDCGMAPIETLEILAPATDTWSLAGRFPSPGVAMTALSGGAVMLVGSEYKLSQFLTATWIP